MRTLDIVGRSLKNACQQLAKSLGNGSSHVKFTFRICCIRCLTRKITGAIKPRGSKIRAIRDKTTRFVRTTSDNCTSNLKVSLIEFRHRSNTLIIRLSLSSKCNASDMRSAAGTESKSYREKLDHILNSRPARDHIRKLV